jgi:hypothetical protein
MLIYLFAITCFRSLSLCADDFQNLQELDVHDFEQQLAGELTLDHIDPMCFLSLDHILACML